MEEIKKRLFRKMDFYKPLFVLVGDRGECELGNIKIYNENGIIIELGQGYFDNGEELTIKGDVIYKLKENFGKKINYIIPEKQNILGNKVYTLYIHIDNIDFKYVGLEKAFDNIYKKYLINNIETKIYVKSLWGNYYTYKNIIEENLEKINKGYNYPMEQEEIQKVFNEIIKYNQLLINEKEWIKNYEPTEKDLADNFETVMKRDI